MKKWGCKDISLRHDNLPDPSRSSLIFFKLFLPSLAVNGQSIIYRLPSILCRQQRISPPFPLKTMRFTPNFQLNWNKFPCCLWRIAKHFRHRKKVKGLIFNSPASLPCSFSHQRKHRFTWGSYISGSILVLFSYNKRSYKMFYLVASFSYTV